MRANQLMGLAKKKTFIALSFTTILFVGCSAEQEQASWTDPIEASDRSVDHGAPQLAASDHLGRIVFGETAAAAKPQIPSHWSLAEADSRH